MKYYSELYQAFYGDPMDYVEDLVSEGSDYETTKWNWDLVPVVSAELDIPKTPLELAQTIRQDIFDFNECMFEQGDNLNKILNVEALAEALAPFILDLHSMQPDFERKVSHKKYLTKNLFDE